MAIEALLDQTVAEFSWLAQSQSKSGTEVALVTNNVCLELLEPVAAQVPIVPLMVVNGAPEQSSEL